MPLQKYHRYVWSCLGLALIMTCTLTIPAQYENSAFAAERPSGPATVDPGEDRDPGIVDLVIASSKEHLGKHYRFRNEFGRAMDCGGFISYVWSLHGVTLPPSSHGIAQQVERVPLEKAEKGDLLFFKGRRKFPGRVSHVGMIIDRNGGGMRMIHSCKRGVVIDDYPVPYYSDRFLFAGRIPALFRSAEAPAIDSPTAGIPASSAPPSKEIVTTIGVGDIMPGTYYPSADYLPPNDFWERAGGTPLIVFWGRPSNAPDGSSIRTHVS